jgi:hypothetical protein
LNFCEKRKRTNQRAKSCNLFSITLTDDEKSWVIPIFVASEVFSTISTEGTRKSLDVHSAPRVLAMSMFERLDGSINELGPKDFRNVCGTVLNVSVSPLQCILLIIEAGHYHLWMLGVCHRNISTSNLIMYWRNPDTQLSGLRSAH